MVTYRTKNSTYPVEYVGQIPAIRLQRGAAAGKFYGILGSYDPESTKFTIQEGIPYFNGIPTTWDALPDQLDQAVSVGNRIVGWLLDEHGSYVSSTQPELETLLKTSAVEEVLETS